MLVVIAGRNLPFVWPWCNTLALVHIDRAFTYVPSTDDEKDVMESSVEVCVHFPSVPHERSIFRALVIDFMQTMRYHVSLHVPT